MPASPRPIAPPPPFPSALRAKRARPGPLLIANAFAVAVLTVAVVVTSALPPRDAPTLGEPSALESASLAPTPVPTTLRSLGTPVSPTTNRSGGATSATESSATDRAATGGGPTLSVQANRAGRRIARYEAVSTCVGTIVLANIAIHSDGAFGVRRQFWLGRRPLVVTLSGTLDRRGIAHGTVRVARNGNGSDYCGLVHFRAKVHSS